MNLFDKKWAVFQKRLWPFRFIPFIDFVLAAGSLATGNMNEDSDFDVIVGVRRGRVFTVRFFCWLVFGIFGWWANHPHKSKDRLCFNHFVTPAAYRLSPPHNEYWKNLYQKLVPAFGSPEIIQKFFDANANWTNERRVYAKDPRHIYRKSGIIKHFREWLLDGAFGDWLEALFKKPQLKRIEKSLKNAAGYKPSIIFNDNELEFHPDTRRIEVLNNSI